MSIYNFNSIHRGFWSKNSETKAFTHNIPNRGWIVAASIAVGLISFGVGGVALFCKLADRAISKNPPSTPTDHATVAVAGAILGVAPEPIVDIEEVIGKVKKGIALSREECISFICYLESGGALDLAQLEQQNIDKFWLMAIDVDKPNAALRLLEAGADINSRWVPIESAKIRQEIGKLAENKASAQGWEQVLLKVVDKADIESLEERSDGRTWLLEVVIRGNKALTEALVRKGVDLNKKTWYAKATALDCAISHKYTEIQTILEQAGAKRSLDLSTTSTEEDRGELTGSTTGPSTNNASTAPVEEDRGELTGTTGSSTNNASTAPVEEDRLDSTGSTTGLSTEVVGTDRVEEERVMNKAETKEFVETFVKDYLTRYTKDSDPMTPQMMRSLKSYGVKVSKLMPSLIEKVPTHPFNYLQIEKMAMSCYLKECARTLIDKFPGKTNKEYEKLFVSVVVSQVHHDFPQGKSPHDQRSDEEIQQLAEAALYTVLAGK